MVLRSILNRLRSLLLRRQFDEDLAAEINTHIELETRKYIAQGMNPSEARRRAGVVFGGAEQTAEACRDVARWRWFESGCRNSNYAFRSLRRNPVFTAVSLLLLTIGVASNIAIFSAIDALFLRTLPVKRPEELVRIASLSKDGHAGALPTTMLPLLRDNRGLNGICAFDTMFRAAELGGGMRQLGIAAYSGSCFQMLDLRMQLGRALNEGDDHPNVEHVAVITDSLWREAFGGRPDVLGSAVRIEDKLYSIVGVTAPGFSGLLVGFPEPLMTPLQQEPSTFPDGRSRAYTWANVFARRAQGFSVEQVHADILAHTKQLLEESAPADYGPNRRKAYLEQKLTVIPAGNGLDYFLRDRFGDTLYAIAALCVVILLMTCVNLTSLLLARSLSRRHEVAVRLAIGAGRAHIAAMFLVENALLLVTGAVIGILVGLACARTVVAHGGEMFGNFSLDVRLDWRVALFVACTLLLVFGIFTAASVWQAGRLANSGALKEGGRNLAAHNNFAQSALLAVQIALTVALVSGAALFAVSVRNMYAIHFGVQPRNVWNVLIAPRPGGYRNFTPQPYYRDLLEQVESLPGVVSASLSNDVPFFHSAYKTGLSSVDTARAVADVQVQVIPIADQYFETLGARLVAGEDFRRAPTGKEQEIIISSSLAEKLGNPGDLIGHHLRLGTDPRYQSAKVTGITADIDMNLANLDDRRPYMVFTDFWQDPDERYPVLIVKTATNQLDLGAIRGILNRGGREFVERISTVSGEIDNALIENRFLAYLSGLFSALALLIAAVGLFGLLSFQVSTRIREIGIRMALGARRLELQWLFLRQVFLLLLVGSVVGMGLLFAIRKMIASLLFGASVSDPAFFFVSCGLLTVTAIAAAWMPVRRATGLDTATVLHYE